ncbi:hypothetical protein SAMN05216600_11731 [Pseudomonas cuatrocienegasensis]|jgi:hypothetical protein|uniref:Uncharacterized protein n=1 Tax=Pseudomonas cuatrocienegasensis TaxID=543360 RepID=A0ABY1BMK6_9PSED|nr:hypothetical protein SAMN05216600_11731 [Pseudomonas cuatrocienegasensis]
MRQLSLLLHAFWSGLPAAVICFAGAICAVTHEEMSDER